jgi:DNA repair protein RadA/Sms
MAKSKTVFVCRNCGNEAPKWIGKCPACGEWNTYTEEIIAKTSAASSTPFSSAGYAPVKLSEIDTSAQPRIDTQTGELNRVLGGGLVRGSVVLIGGEPGIGKSTLALQVALGMSNFKVLYISGEESAQQIRMRADRLGKENENCYVLCEVSLQNI